MISEDFVIIPIERQSIVPVGIGSVSISNNGHMNVVIAVDSFGKTLNEQFRRGKIKAIRIVAVPVEEGK